MWCSSGRFGVFGSGINPIWDLAGDGGRAGKREGGEEEGKKERKYLTPCWRSAAGVADVLTFFLSRPLKSAIISCTAFATLSILPASMVLSLSPEASSPEL